MNDFLTFRKMITPVVIQVLFWIGVLVMLIAAIVFFAQGTGASIVGGLFMLILGPLMVRIYCELLIVAFKILEALREIQKNTSAPGHTA